MQLTFLGKQHKIKRINYIVSEYLVLVLEIIKNLIVIFKNVILCVLCVFGSLDEYVFVNNSQELMERC